MEKYRALVLFGAPGSGKGTQGKFLSKVTNHLHISSGEILRDLPRDSELGKLFHGYMDKGELGPDDMMIEVFKEYIENLVSKGKYDPENQLLMLDGIPRTVPQVKLLEALVEVEKVVFFDVGSKEALMERISKRAAIEGRADDTSMSILEERMNVFEGKTLKVMGAYPKEKLITINAAQGPLFVLKDVLNHLTPLLAR